MRRMVLPVIVAVAAAGLLVWAFLPRPVAVETGEVALRSLVVEIEEEGEARIREVFVVSAPIAGRMQRIALHPGDAVTAGETVVARIGPAAPALLDARSRAVAEAAVAAAQAAVELARAQLAQAEAARDFALTEAARSQALFERAALSRRVLDNAILAQRTAEAAVASAEANLAMRERERDSAVAVIAAGAGGAAESCCIEVVTPVSGRILRVLAENEQLVQGGMPVLEIGNPGNMAVVVDLLSRDAVRVVEGAAARVTGWGGEPLPARVERIEPAAEVKVSALGIEERRVRVILALTGDAEARAALGHGFRALAAIEVWRGEEVLAVPVGALFRDGPDWAAYVLRDGRALLQRIVLGERNADLAQVLDGLAPGDRVILHPGDGLADGRRVEALP